MRASLRRTLTPLVVLLAAAPVAADAAVVRVEESVETTGEYRDEYDEVTKIVRIVGRAGERNRITVRKGDKRNRWIVIDRGRRRPAAGYGCKRRGRNAVVCGIGTHDKRLLSASLGDRRDRFGVSGRLQMPIVVRGGAGNDDLRAGRARGELSGGGGNDLVVGGPGGDRLYGDAGRDRLLGRRGGDRLYDGPGRDRLAGGRENDVLYSNEGGTPVSDRLDGGPGTDAVTYVKRKRPITGTLGARAGVAGERDVLRRIEELSGTRQADVLTGDARPNRIHGNGGADRIDGRAGADRLIGGRGTTVTCGTGTDHVVANRLGATLLEPDCELVANTTGVGEVSAQIAGSTREALTVGQHCRAGVLYPRRPQLMTPGARLPWSTGDPMTLLAGGDTEAPEGKQCRAPLTLTDAGRALLVPGSQVVVAVDGEPRWTVRLTVPAG